MKNYGLPSEAFLQNLLCEILNGDDAYDDYGLDFVTRISQHYIEKAPDANVMPDIMNCYIYEQVPLGQYGIIDLFVTFDIAYQPRQENSRIESHAVIIELKKDPITHRSYDQVLRYVSGVKRLDLYTSVTPILIGYNGNESDYIYHNIPDLIVYDYDYTPKGITFMPRIKYAKALQVSADHFKNYLKRVDNEIYG